MSTTTVRKPCREWLAPNGWRLESWHQWERGTNGALSHCTLCDTAYQEFLYRAGVLEEHYMEAYSE